MARKERNDIDYFPHPVTHGKKMFYLRDKYGNDAYAVWFILLEQLGRANYHYLNLSDKMSLKFLTVDTKVSEETLLNIINELVDFGDFDAELWNQNKILFNEKFIENISDAYKKRNNECIDKNSLLLLLDSKGIRKLSKSTPKLDKSNLKGYGNTQRIVKDSKGKESKENKIPSFDVFLEYTLEHKPNINKVELKNKYLAWKENDWRDGYDKKISNWKSKILNNLKYIGENKSSGTTFNSPVL